MGAPRADPCTAFCKCSNQQQKKACVQLAGTAIQTPGFSAGTAREASLADLANDPWNCGACFKACGDAGPYEYSACVDGLCEYDCVSSADRCNGTCTVLAWDPDNCGLQQCVRWIDPVLQSGNVLRVPAGLCELRFRLLQQSLLRRFQLRRVRCCLPRYPHLLERTLRMGLRARKPGLPQLLTATFCDLNRFPGRVVRRLPTQPFQNSRSTSFHTKGFSQCQSNGTNSQNRWRNLFLAENRLGDLGPFSRGPFWVPWDSRLPGRLRGPTRAKRSAGVPTNGSRMRASKPAGIATRSPAACVGPAGAAMPALISPMTCATAVPASTTVGLKPARTSNPRVLMANAFTTASRALLTVMGHAVIWAGTLPIAAQCGNLCGGSTPYCNQGTCTACPPGQTLCTGSCVDLAFDGANCGACGNVCDEWTPVCNQGTCIVCQEGLTDCGGFCTDLQWDEYNCGACGYSCWPAGCQSGSCGQEG